MKKVILTATINPADRDMLRQINERIEQETNMKFGVSMIVARLISMLNRKGMKERIERDMVARKREQIRNAIMRTAKREIQRIGGDKYDNHV